MSKVSCNIIKDILPLYYDNICSDDSKIMVEEHLAECSSCKCELDKIKADIKLPEKDAAKNYNDSNAIKIVANMWNSSRLRAFIKGLIIATVLSIALFFGYIGVFHWDIIKVPMDVVKISNVCQLQDDRIAYHVKLTDGYALGKYKFSLDKDGNYYIIPYRRIIKGKPMKENELENRYNLFDIAENNAWQQRHGDGIKIKAIYYGSAKDNILIWKEGMELPKASEEVENMFRPQ